MGKFNLNRFLTKNSTGINEIIGGLEDAKVIGNYSDALAEFDQLQQQRDRLKRFTELNQKLMGVDYSTVPKYREEVTNEFNYDHPSLYDGTNQELMDKYNSYKTNYETTTGKPEGVKTLSDYVEHYPELKQDLLNKGLYTQGKKQIAFDENEYEQMIYQSAGLTPEDVEFYKSGINDNLNAEDYNRNLLNLVAQKYPNLISYKGRQGDNLAKMLGNRAESMTFTPPKYENPWKTDVKDDKVIRINQNTGEVSVNEIEGLKKPGKNTVQKYFDMGYDEALNLPADELKDNFMLMNPDVQAQLKATFPVLQNMEDKINKSGVYSKNTGGKRYGGRKGSSNINFGNYKPDQFKNLSPAELEKLGAGDLYELQKYSNMLSSETRDKLTNMLSGVEGDPGGDEEELNAGNVDSPDEFAQYKQELYQDADEDERAVLDDVEAWITDTINAWGRSSLTADEWRQEYSQESKQGWWNDLTDAIAKKIFKERFGVSL